MKAFKTLFLLFSLCGFSLHAVSDDAGVEVEVTVLDYHDPGYFKIEFMGRETTLFFYYESFRFEDLNKKSLSFPQQAKLSINGNGQILSLSNDLSGLVLGDGVADRLLEDCFGETSSTMSMMICADEYLRMLINTRSGLVTNLMDRQDSMSDSTKVMFNRLLELQQESYTNYNDLLTAVDSERNLGSAFRYESLLYSARQINAQIEQLEFLFENLR
jgi:hypothetical protein